MILELSICCFHIVFFRSNNGFLNSFTIEYFKCSIISHGSFIFIDIAVWWSNHNTVLWITWWRSIVTFEIIWRSSVFGNDGHGLRLNIWGRRGFIWSVGTVYGVVWRGVRRRVSRGVQRQKVLRNICHQILFNHRCSIQWIDDIWVRLNVCNGCCILWNTFCGGIILGSNEGILCNIICSISLI